MEQWASEINKVADQAVLLNKLLPYLRGKRPTFPTGRLLPPPTTTLFCGDLIEAKWVAGKCCVELTFSGSRLYRIVARTPNPKGPPHSEINETDDVDMAARTLDLFIVEMAEMDASLARYMNN